MFWKNISFHTHAFLFLIFNALRYVFKNQVIFLKKMFFQIFDWSNLIFDQSKSFWKILVSLCLVRLIELVFQSIEHHESSFLKTQFWLVQTSFQHFSKFFFSLSDSRRLHKDFFCRFPPKFLQSFSLPKPVCLYYPSFCIVFLIFMHNLMVFG